MSVFARRDLDEFSNASSTNVSRSQSFSLDTDSGVGSLETSSTLLLDNRDRGSSLSMSIYDETFTSVRRDTHTHNGHAEAPSSSFSSPSSLPATPFNPRSPEALEAAREHSYRQLLRQHRTRAELHHQSRTKKRLGAHGTIAALPSSVLPNYDSIGEHKPQLVDGVAVDETATITSVEIKERKEGEVDGEDDNDDDDDDNGNGVDSGSGSVSVSSPTSAFMRDKAKAAADQLKKLKKYAPPSPFLPPIAVPEGSGLYPLRSTDMTQIDELGLSGRLYFRYIRAFAVVTCIMSFFSFYMMGYNKVNADSSLYDEYGFLFKFTVGNRFATYVTHIPAH
jgi:hypothetical protein